MSVPYIIDSGQECISTGEGVYEAELVGPSHSAIVARSVVSGGANNPQRRLAAAMGLPLDVVDGGNVHVIEGESFNGEKVVSDLVKKRSEPLSEEIESNTWEEVDRVLRTSSSMCRSLIARVEAKGTPIDVARIIGYELGRLPQDFMRVVQQACKPSTSWFMPGLHSESMGALLYLTAQEALPIAESLENAERLDRAFPQAASPAASLRF